MNVGNIVNKALNDIENSSVKKLEAKDSKKLVQDKDGTVNPESILEKDDFLKLLLVELQHQDPTSPMDTAKILSQTSQLATLEASKNTNDSLKDLSGAMSRNYSVIDAIGKLADLGKNNLILKEEGEVKFDLYFEDNIKNGEIQIISSNGEVVKKLELNEQEKGVKSFEWDGKNSKEERAQEGLYTVKAIYNNKDGEERVARYGLYPISSVKFENGKPLLKLGTNYISIDMVKEIYGNKL